jgi:hypothetical protein
MEEEGDEENRMNLNELQLANSKFAKLLSF